MKTARWIAMGMMMSGLLMGCGSNGNAGSPGAGGGGTGGGGAGGSGTGGGDTRDPLCSVKEIEAKTSRTIRVTNRTVDVIRTLGCAPRFSVEVDGERLPGELSEWSMRSCEDTAESGQPCCGCETGGLAIEPGATLEIAWDGRAWADSTIPRSCVEDSEAQSDVLACYRATEVPAEGEPKLVLHLDAPGVGPFEFETAIDMGEEGPAVLEIEITDAG